MNSTHIKRFENLDCWNRSRELTNLIYDLTLNNTFSSDRSFVDQIRRASISVMNNIAEGFDRSSNRDFIKFMFIAKASASEVRSMLYIALDRNYITNDEFDKAFSFSVSCSQLSWGLIKNLKTRIGWKASILFFSLLTATLLVMKYF